jgi:flagellar biosynthesis protein FliQ
MLLLAALFAIAVRGGESLAGQRREQSIGLLVWSIVPIALAYHFSHYLTALLVDGQSALIALSDPFARGWNLLGLSGRHAEAGIVMGHEAAWTIWNAQAAAIVAGHVLAVLIAHMLALRLYGDIRAATLSQLPLAALMVAYTLLGLWLLSTPSAG